MPQQMIRQGLRELHRQILQLAALIIFVVLVVGWFGDYRSCERQIPIRHFLREDAALNRQAAKQRMQEGDLKAAQRLTRRAEAEEAVPIESCLKLFPGT